jgi:hypothetical protein
MARKGDGSNQYAEEDGSNEHLILIILNMFQ